MDGPPGAGWSETFAALIGAFGADRLAWGSNYPSSAGSLAELLATALQATVSLSEAEVDWLFGRTALKLYPALAQAPRRPEQPAVTAGPGAGNRR